MTDADEITFELRRDSAKVHCFRRHGGNETHQALYDRSLDWADPGNSDQDESDRESKVAQPGNSADCPDREQRDRNNDGGVNPAERAPVLVSNFENAQREKKHECRQPDYRGDQFAMTSDL